MTDQELIAKIKETAKQPPTSPLGPSLFYLPICLTKIKDEDAVNAVMQEITNCQVNSPDPLCPDSKTMNEIKESFNLKTKFPPINEWTDSILAQFGGVPMAPVSLVPYFNDQLIKKAKPDIIKGAAKRTLLKTVLPLMSGSISMAQGSEFPAKVAALMEANMQSALNGNTFTYSNINEALRLHQPQVYS
ncbi:hypothetical protein Hamer_G017601 [Homarus americanus]|uniref:Uncharacterized protein n=1 Tax=Homarus americanus TaxID=6706 RepID=A0A8J5JCT5_HOMAM|nr:hypothetical protein Hamer_G017601 [Homarus americanus]